MLKSDLGSAAGPTCPRKKICSLPVPPLLCLDPSPRISFPSFSPAQIIQFCNTHTAFMGTSQPGGRSQCKVTPNNRTKEKDNQSYHQSLLDQSHCCEVPFGGNENRYWNELFKAVICILFVLLLQELRSACTPSLQGLSMTGFLCSWPMSKGRQSMVIIFSDLLQNTGQELSPFLH